MYRLVVLSPRRRSPSSRSRSRSSGWSHPRALELVVTLAVLSAVCIGVDAAAQAILEAPLAARVLAHHRAHPAVRAAPDPRPGRTRGDRARRGSRHPSRSTSSRGGPPHLQPGRRRARRCSPSWRSGVPALGASSWWVGTPVHGGSRDRPRVRSCCGAPRSSGSSACSSSSRSPSPLIRTSAQYQAAGVEIDTAHALLADPVVVAVPVPRRVHALRAADPAAAPLAAVHRRGRRRRLRRLADRPRGDQPRPGAGAAHRQRRRVRALAADRGEAHAAGPHRAHADRAPAHLPHPAEALVRPRPVPRARGAAPPPGRPRHPPRVQHRLGARGSARS